MSIYRGEVRTTVERDEWKSCFCEQEILSLKSQNKLMHVVNSLGSSSFEEKYDSNHFNKNYLFCERNCWRIILPFSYDVNTWELEVTSPTTRSWTPAFTKTSWRCNSSRPASPDRATTWDAWWLSRLDTSRTRVFGCTRPTSRGGAATYVLSRIAAAVQKYPPFQDRQYRECRHCELNSNNIDNKD